MAGAIKHRFVSSIPDDPDTSKIKTQSDWNDSLVVSGGTAWQFARRDTGATDGWSLEDPSTVYDARKNGVVANTGTNQTANVLAACAAASAVADSFQTVLLPPGTIHVVGLDLTNYHVHLRGHTQGHTILRRFTDTDHVIKINLTSSSNHWEFSDLRIDGRIPAGTSSTTWDGINVRTTTGTLAFANFHRVYVSGNRYGIELGNNATLCTVTSCVFGNNTSRGLAITSSGTGTMHRIMGNWFDENGDQGLYCNSIRNLIIGNNFMDNTTYHIFLDTNGSFNLVQGNMFVAGTVLGTVTVMRCFGDSNEFIWNTIANVHSGVDSIIDAGGDNNVIVGRFLDALTITDGGTGNIIHRLNDAGQYLFPIGSAADPSMSFIGDDDTGFRRSAANEIQAIVGGLSAWIARSTQQVDCSGALRVNGDIGFYNIAPVAKQTVTGSRGGNAALASLLTALAAIGLITNSSSA